MKLSGIQTPALILDVNTLKANAEQMKKLLEGTSLKLRPHYKSHKCASIAKWQVANGAIGMTCAKLSEAEDLILSGGIPNELWYSYSPLSQFENAVKEWLALKEVSPALIAAAGDQVPPGAEESRILRMTELVEEYGYY